MAFRINFDLSLSVILTPASRIRINSGGAQKLTRHALDLLTTPRFTVGIHTQYLHPVNIFLCYCRNIRYRHHMPNQRAAGQRLVNVPMDEEFIDQLHAAMLAAGYTNRSDFIRSAIVEKASAIGIKIPRSLALAPPRVKHQIQASGQETFNDNSKKSPRERTQCAHASEKGYTDGAQNASAEGAAQAFQDAPPPSPPASPAPPPPAPPSASSSTASAPVKGQPPWGPGNQPPRRRRNVQKPPPPPPPAGLAGRVSS